MHITVRHRWQIALFAWMLLWLAAVILVVRNAGFEKYPGIWFDLGYFVPPVGAAVALYLSWKQRKR